MKKEKAERLLDLMALLPDHMLEEAVTYHKLEAKKVTWNKGALVAACVSLFLISGLMWSTLQESGGAFSSTEAGITEGALTGAGGAQTLAPTLAQGADPTGGAEWQMQGFWFCENWYVPSGQWVEELPENCVYQGTLFYQMPTTEPQAVMTDWLTADPLLDGAKVYGVTQGDGVLYVNSEGVCWEFQVEVPYYE